MEDFKAETPFGASGKDGNFPADDGKPKWRGENAMKDYTKFMKWAVITMIDRSTQDNRRSKVNVEALFSSPAQAEGNYMIRNPEIKRYILNVDDLERFEAFYNHVQDINEKFGDHAIFHINDGFTVDELNRFRTLLNLWTDTKIS